MGEQGGALLKDRGAAHNKSGLSQPALHPSFGLQTGGSEDLSGGLCGIQDGGRQPLRRNLGVKKRELPRALRPFIGGPPRPGSAQAVQSRSKRRNFG